MPSAPSRTGVVRNLERWVVWPFASISGLLGAIAVGSIFRGGIQGPFGTAELTLVGIVTGVLTLSALRLAFCAKSPAAVAWATFGSAILFAAINSPACFVAVSVLGGTLSPSDLPEAIFLSGFIGLFFSLPLGCTWALALVGPMFVVAKLREEPSLDGPARAVRAVGGTLAVVSVLGLPFALGSTELPLVLLAIALIGAVAVIAATSKLHRLERFLARVRGGELPGWDIVPLRDLDDAEIVANDLPSTDIDHHPDAVLVRIVDAGGDGAYRIGGPSRIAWARTRL